MYFFTKSTYNEYIGLYFLSHVVSKKIANAPPKGQLFLNINVVWATPWSTNVKDTPVCAQVDFDVGARNGVFGFSQHGGSRNLTHMGGQVYAWWIQTT